VPDAILLKTGRLTPDEFEIMKRHTEIGDALCAPLQSLRRVRPIVRSHHERLDGSGYPSALRGDEVPVLAQIVGIVDVFDALTSERPYRRANTPEETAHHLITEAAQGKFSMKFVEAFFDTLALEAAPTSHIM
jgi:putative two-component system response regulator